MRFGTKFGLGLLACCGLAAQVQAATAESITLSNAKGVSAHILTDGATLQSLMWPDRKANMAGHAPFNMGETYRHVMVLRPGKVK